MGDSIAYAADGGTHERMRMPYVRLVLQDLGLKSHPNLPKNGATVSDVRPSNNIMSQMATIPDDVDVICVLIGGNDFLGSVPPGDVDDMTQSTVCGSYNLLIDGIRKKCPALSCSS